MTRAFEPVLLLLIVDRAGKMSAFLAKGYESIGSGAYQNAWLAGGRVLKYLDGAHGELVNRRYGNLRILRGLVEYRPREDPEVAYEHPEACEG